MPILPHTLPPTTTKDVGGFEIRSDSARPLHRFCAEHVLGTRLEVLVNTPSLALAEIAVIAAREEIERLNHVFNGRRTDSEISRLNRLRIATASEELFAVLRLSEAWRRITHGAFDGRMGALLRLWTHDANPSDRSVEQTLASLQDSDVKLNAVSRRVELSSAELSLDAIAKGYIVDAALNAACRAGPAIEGIAISVGGDIRCWGTSPHPRGWRIGIPDPAIPFENAPSVDAVSITNAAIATSGRGPRDCTRGGYRSTTISPFTGRPVSHTLSASVVASHAADADAIATACMVLEPAEGIVLVDHLEMAARIVDAQQRVSESKRWSTLRLAAASTTQRKSSSILAKEVVHAPASSDKNPIAVDRRWPADWEIGITYSEPDRKEEQGADFRTPYIALWITDEQDKPVRTVFMLGTAAKWHRDNFVWWASIGERAAELVDLRSQATTRSGRYQMYWGGLDDDWKPVPIGKYVLHIETSQEHGKHSHRAVDLNIARERFKMSLPNLIDSGGVAITYGHYNDRFKSDD